ncbi:ATPase [Thermus filiformis]|uniref:ATPase n=1 Tax=Thermus filiformis TaxID=276 RepID=A0A0A2WM91_THEFI|nr:ATPase [Thermus filiformis]
MGVVVGSARGDYWTEIILLLTHKELEGGRGLLLGELVRVVFQERGRERSYVGMVTDAYYAPVAEKEHAKVLAEAQMNTMDLQQEDPWAVRRINFLHYRILVLGAMDEDMGLFRPSTRIVPPVLHARVFRLSEEELSRLVRASLARTEESGKGTPVGLGHLCYGAEEEGEHKGVIKPVSPALFVGRRTANFGKTGYGKSNENKVILTLVAHAFPEVGFLILDLNGEYALQTEGTTSKGLAQVFRDLGLEGRLVFYTAQDLEKIEERFGRVMGEDYQRYVEIRPLKVDFYENPELALAMAYARARLEGKSLAQYFEEAYFGFDESKENPNRMAYVYGAFRKAGLLPSPGFRVRLGNESYDLYSDWESLSSRLNQGSDQQQEESNQQQQRRNRQQQRGENQTSTRQLYRYSGRFSFLRRFHAWGAGDVFKAITTNLFEEKGRVVILDLPSLAEMADFFVQYLMTRLFERAVELYGERQANFILVLEEAHNVLGDEAGIFYRVAKEGRKYGIGMLYSTQSPSGIPSEILSQTENFLVKHLSSEEDVKALTKAKVAFAPVAGFLLSEPIIGYSYIYLEPYQPFVLPLKVRLLEEVVQELQEIPSRATS